MAYLYLFLLLPGCLIAEDHIRGFLYEVEDGWILAPEPNLRSCCVGSDANREKQVRVEEMEESPSTWKAVTLSGDLFKDPETHISYLQNPKVVQEKGFPFFLVTGVILGIALIALFFRRRQ